MAGQYMYSELRDGHIRILRLQPELERETLHGTVHEVALKDSKDAFVAVSWTWDVGGNRTSQRQIILDGNSLEIAPNLGDMLDVFRQHQPCHDLWIDAICINQDKRNPREKSRQIPMMAEIYQAAKEVHIWLGPAADDSDYVMQSLGSEDKEAFLSSRFVAGLFNILLRPWWRRTWILQEYVLNATSPKAFIGDSAGVSTELMLQIWRRQSTVDVWMRITDHSTLPDLLTIYRLYHTRQSRHNPNAAQLKPNLRNALLWLKDFEVIEPRDKVYGGLGLIESRYREEFLKTVGVHSNRDAAKVFRDATIYLLKSERNSTIFYDFPPGRLGKSGVPSWIPNYNLDRMSSLESIIRLGDVTSDRLDTPREEVNISDDHSSLIVRGHILDMVKDVITIGDSEVAPGWNRHGDVNNLIRIPFFLHQIDGVLQQIKSRSAHQQLVWEPLWKTLIAGFYGSIRDPELDNEAECQQQFDKVMNIPLVDPLRLPEEVSWRDLCRLHNSEKPRNDDIMEYLESFRQSTDRSPHILYKIQRTLSTGRIFFRGEVDVYGLCEVGARAGDFIALLLPDHFIPFILRPTGEAWEMVGVAYLPEPILNAAIAGIEADRNCLRPFDII